ncbi:hypothetical protein [Vibrio phage VP41s3]|nr:hypothetical protein [Vibrio phage VP41s3]
MTKHMTLSFADRNHKNESTLVYFGDYAKELAQEDDAVFTISQCTIDENDESMVDMYHFNMDETIDIYNAMRKFFGDL